jgi:RHS repeat-associated protein
MKLKDNTWTKYYSIHDHLGNVRSLLRKYGSSYVIDKQYDYDAWGGVLWQNDTKNERTKYIGKETDYESGDHNHGVRQYSDYVGRFLCPDGLWEKDFTFSPYHYSHNNPLILKDINGEDDYFYNKDASTNIVIPMNGSDRHFLEDPSGNVKIGSLNFYQGLSKESFFGDRNAKEKGLFDKVDNETISNDKKINVIVDKNTPANETWTGFWSESGDYGLYDYKEGYLKNNAQDKNNNKTAYLVNGILMNRNEAGNVLWGATAAKLGIPLWLSLSGAQGFSIIFEQKMDESAEQNAIEKGYESNENR